MKIRNGFVSNSSSSSFVVAITNETFESIQNGTDIGITPLQLKALKNFRRWSSVKIFGQDCRIIQCTNSNEDGDLRLLNLTDEEDSLCDKEGFYSCCDVVNSIKHPGIFSRDSGY